MGWVRIDDGFYDHLRHAGHSLEAIGLWVVLLAWCNRNLTDGKVPTAVVDRFDNQGYVIKELVESGALEESTPGFYEIHDYLEWQPSAAQVREKRERERARWQRRGERRTDPSTTETGRAPPQLRGDSTAEGSATPPASQPQEQTPSGSGARSNGHRELFGALIDVFGPASTKGRQKLYGDVAKQLGAAGATPDDVRDRGKRMHALGWKQPGPRALEIHWDELGGAVATSALDPDTITRGGS